MAATLLTDTELERDRRLVEAHQGGDVSAFGRLYELHYERLRRFCLRKVRDPHLAEEIAQETFLKAYRGLDELEGGKRFYPWLTVIAARLVIDHHRRTSRVRPVADIDLTGFEPVDTDDDAHERIEREVDREHVRMALERVRVRHREVLRLRDYEDLSYEAIAQRLGTTPAIVQSLLHRARGALRREYLAVIRQPALLPLAATVRWLRHRAGRLALWVPDPSALGAPLAVAAVAVSAALGAGILPTSPSAPHAREDGRPPAVRSSVTADVAPAERAATIGPATGTRSVPAPPPRERPAQVWLGRSGAQTARARGEQMPARVDTGSALVAVDPETIAEDVAHTVRALLGGN